MTVSRFILIVLAVLLAGCATAPVPQMHRDADLSRTTGVAGTSAQPQDDV